jgi:hypothetical protein
LTYALYFIKLFRMSSEEKEERIGDFMVRIGALTQDQVMIILKKQKEEPDKLFGVIAIELGLLNSDALNTYIKEQEKKKQ